MYQLDLSYSSLSIGCERKFEFRKFFHVGYRSSGLAAEVGHALHYGYQDYLISGDEVQAQAIMLTAYPIKLNEKGNMGDRSPEACYATLEHAIHSELLMQYEIATINCPDGVERPAIEVPFRIRLKDTFLDEACTIPIFYIGYIDVMLFDRMTTLYTTADIKTHRNKQYDLSPLYQYNEQTIPYGLVLEHMHGGLIESFDVGYISLYIDVLEPRAQFYNYTKTQQDLSDWLLGLTLKVKQFQIYYKLNYWPRNGNNCFNFFRTCGHFQYCSTRDRDPAVMNSLMMRDADWEDAHKEKEQREFEPWVEFELEMAA